MTFESDETVIAGTGHVFTADVGTAFPASIADDVDDTLWLELGYTTEDGVHPLFDRQTKDFFAWQVRDIIRTITTSVPKKIDFVLRQWNQNTFELAMGGGTWEDVGSGEYEYTPPADSFVDERALIVEWTDGDKNYRLLFAKCINKAPFDTVLRGDDMANLPISMSVLAADGDDRTWFGQTDDDNLGLAAAAGS